jgi:predicted MPP superfamily phosphohydrolase
MQNGQYADKKYSPPANFNVRVSRETFRGDDAMTKKKKPPVRGRRWVAALFLAFALAIGGLIGFSYLNASVIHVERVVIVSPDLPEAFDGVKVLYVSDVDVVGLRSPEGAARAILRLARLEPDILILGGDYAGDSLLDAINQSGSELKLEGKRRALFSALAAFDAPLGKFAVAGENDAGAQDLAGEMQLGGISLLSDSGAWVETGADRIAVVGLRDASAGATDYGGVAARFSRSDFVIVVSHNPANAAGVLSAEAGDSGAWCDLILTGHNHGGQAMLFGRTMLRLTQSEERFRSGWHKESGVHLLVSEGMGCEKINLRLGTQAQAHLITLRRGVLPND